MSQPSVTDWLSAIPAILMVVQVLILGFGSFVIARLSRRFTSRHKGDVTASKVEALESRFAAVEANIKGLATHDDIRQLQREFGEVSGNLKAITAAQEGLANMQESMAAQFRLIFDNELRKAGNGGERK